jgi:hypothetical protein
VKFKQEEIRMSVLLTLSEEALKSLVPALGPRMQIRCFLQQRASIAQEVYPVQSSVDLAHEDLSTVDDKHSESDTMPAAAAACQGNGGLRAYLEKERCTELLHVYDHGRCNDASIPVDCGKTEHKPVHAPTKFTIYGEPPLAANTSLLHASPSSPSSEVPDKCGHVCCCALLRRVETLCEDLESLVRKMSVAGPERKTTCTQTCLEDTRPDLATTDIATYAIHGNLSESSTNADDQLSLPERRFLERSCETINCGDGPSHQGTSRPSAEASYHSSAVVEPTPAPHNQTYLQILTHFGHIFLGEHGPQKISLAMHPCTGGYVAAVKVPEISLYAMGSAMSTEHAAIESACYSAVFQWTRRVNLGMPIPLTPSNSATLRHSLETPTICVDTSVTGRTSPDPITPRASTEYPTRFADQSALSSSSPGPATIFSWSSHDEDQSVMDDIMNAKSTTEQAGQSMPRMSKKMAKRLRDRLQRIELVQRLPDYVEYIRGTPKQWRKSSDPQTPGASIRKHFHARLDNWKTALHARAMESRRSSDLTCSDSIGKTGNPQDSGSVVADERELAIKDSSPPEESGIMCSPATSGFAYDTNHAGKVHLEPTANCTFSRPTASPHTNDVQIKIQTQQAHILVPFAPLCSFTSSGVNSSMHPAIPPSLMARFGFPFMPAVNVASPVVVPFGAVPPVAAAAVINPYAAFYAACLAQQHANYVATHLQYAQSMQHTSSPLMTQLLHNHPCKCNASSFELHYH